MAANAATIWEGSINTGSWGSQEGVSCVKVGTANFATAAVGDKLTVSAAPAGDDAQLLIKGGDWEMLPGVDGIMVTAAGDFSTVLTSASLETLKTTGLLLQGNNITITKVDLTSSVSFEYTTVWTGDASITWNDAEAPGVDATDCAKLKAGDVITLTVSEIAGDDWPKCCFRTKAEGNKDLGTIELWDFKNDAMPIEKSLVVDADNLEAYQAGFYIVGCGCKISKIAIGIKEGEPEPPVAANVLWQGPEAEMTWGSNGVVVSAEKAAVLKAGDTLNVTISRLSDTEEWPKVVVRSEDGWDEIYTYELWDFRSDAMPMVRSVVLTDAMMPLVAKGFNLGGCGAWVTEVSYTSEGTSSVGEIAADAATVDVYNMQGVCVRRNVEAANAAADLAPGLYIIAGRKVLVK